MDDFSPQGLGNLAWAFARQAQLVEEVKDRVNVAARMASTSGRMAVYSTICFDVGELLIQRLFAAIADTDLRVHGMYAVLRP